MPPIETACEPLPVLGLSELLEGLVVKLQKSQGASSLEINATKCYPITKENQYNGIKLSIISDSTGSDLLMFFPIDTVTSNYVTANLDHPYTEFQLDSDGDGIGIADVRDLRTGGKFQLHFNLFETDLYLAVIEAADNLWGLVFSWDDNYSPY